MKNYKEAVENLEKITRKIHSRGFPLVFPKPEKMLEAYSKITKVYKNENDKIVAETIKLFDREEIYGK